MLDLGSPSDFYLTPNFHPSSIPIQCWTSAHRQIPAQSRTFTYHLNFVELQPYARLLPDVELLHVAKHSSDFYLTLNLCPALDLYPTPSFRPLSPDNDIYDHHHPPTTDVDFEATMAAKLAVAKKICNLRGRNRRRRVCGMIRRIVREETHINARMREVMDAWSPSIAVGGRRSSLKG
ncbi:hypothetical protein MA16_Dca018012 [Dendrobium catenatum]|uniref:Uncharacterized protein n=1 Tax=Dendrobium catenatum TaxID=906689 RepID=A0A2I0WPD0_9ASPA|nr:hypothetical protein MA16_Dca018012 [Dendrobium catenatum]